MTNHKPFVVIFDWGHETTVHEFDTVEEAYEDRENYIDAKKHGVYQLVSSESQWSREIPTEPGYYYFYGDAWTPKEKEFDKNDLSFVVIRTAKNNSKDEPMYICDGNFMFPKSSHPGLWAKARIPAIDLDNIPPFGDTKKEIR